MRYAIYLDEVEVENFFSDSKEAVKKYEDYVKEYKGEDIYDKIELFAFRTVKEETL